MFRENYGSEIHTFIKSVNVILLLLFLLPSSFDPDSFNTDVHKNILNDWDAWTSAQWKVYFIYRPKQVSILRLHIDFPISMKTHIRDRHIYLLSTVHLLKSSAKNAIPLSWA
jgi:hypothetical protein